MNLLDVVIVLSAISASLAGYRLGLVARAISWIGLAAGLGVAAWVLPSVLDSFSGADEVRLFFAAVGILVAGGALGQALGLVLGGRARVALPPGQARTVDRAGGSVVGLLGVVVLVWVLVPTMANVPGWPAEQARNSAIARAVVSTFPEAPDTFQTLRQVIGKDRFPEVFAALEPTPDLGRPPAATGISPAVSDRVARSTFRIESRACGRIQEGSGFAVREDVVLTNAHVVAGAETTEVVRTDGSRASGTVVGFDPDRDLAALRVEGLVRSPLPVVAPEIGDRGGVYGYPGGGNLEISPYQIARRTEAIGTDIYDRDRIRREVLFLSSSLAPGDSGSALIDPSGRVVGVAFAIAPDRDRVGYALTEKEVGAFLQRRLADAVDAGPCLG